jgi:hypothetical protein
MSSYQYGYTDFRDNFPDLYRQLKSTYYEGLESYRVPSNISWARTNSRTSVKRTAKKQAGQRNIHKTESQLNPDAIHVRDRALLVIRFEGNKHIGYVAHTNIGTIWVLWFDWCKSWLAYASDKQNQLFAVYESKISYQDALARLFALQWGSHKYSPQIATYTLFDLYRGIWFDFADKNAPKPRNNTIVFRTHKDVHPIWS